MLVKGARQMGKTSLLARGLQQARRRARGRAHRLSEARTPPTASRPRALLRTLAGVIADQLDLDVSPDEVWDPRRGPSINFERYLRREVLGKIASGHRLGPGRGGPPLHLRFGSEVFGLFRSWHNERALDPTGPWPRLTLAIAYATEAHLFITDLNQSPFNVGTRLTLEDFTLEQVPELNRRYGSPLRDEAEVDALSTAGRRTSLPGRSAACTRWRPAGSSSRRWRRSADHDDGPFGDPPAADAGLARAGHDAVRGGARRARGPGLPDAGGRSTACGARAWSPATRRGARPRCQLYATYLERHLL